MKSQNRVSQLKSPMGSTLEVLESRIAPATLSAPGTFTYTDDDGDVVKVSVAGRFTSVDFLNELGQDVVANGGDVASVIVSKPGTDFAITVVADDVVGAGVVTLGNITGEADARLPIIKGVFTVPSADNSVRYDLAGFRGTGFSVDGGLSVFGRLTGAAADGAGLDVTNVPVGTSVLISQGIEVGATASVTKGLLGKINIGGTLDGSLTVGNLNGQLLVGEVPGTIVIQNGLKGQIFTEEVSGTLEVQGKMSINARISSSDNLNLKVGGDFSGYAHVVGNLTLDVGANMSVGEVLVGSMLTLDVGGSILKSRISAQDQFTTNTGVRKDIVQSYIVGGTGVELSVGRNVDRSRLSSGHDDMNILINGRLLDSQLHSGDDMELSLGGAITGSRVLPDGQLLAVVQRDVTKTVIGSQSSSTVVSVGGRMMATQLIAGTDANLTVTGDLSTLDAIVGDNTSVTVGGNASKLKFSVGEELDMQVTGNLINSILLPANTLSVNVAKDILGSQLGSFDNNTSVTVGGTLKNSRVDSGESVFVTASTFGLGTRIRAASDIVATASTKVEGSMVANGDISVTTTGVFTASISAAQNISIVADSVNISSKSAGLVQGSKGTANPTSDAVEFFRGVRAGGDLEVDVVNSFKAPLLIAGGDVTRFHIGGDFSASFTVAGDFVPGEITESTTVVGGITSKSTVIDIGGNVGSATSSPKLIFGDAFLGQLSVDGQLLTDLEFGGNVNRLTFNGGVGPALLGDNIVNIIVNGTLASLSSASLFQRTDAMSGKFVDGEGEVIGLLATTVAAVKVTPDDFTV